MEEFWGDNVRSTPMSTESHMILGEGVAACLLLSAHRAVIFAIAQLSCFIDVGFSSSTADSATLRGAAGGPHGRRGCPRLAVGRRDRRPGTVRALEQGRTAAGATWRTRSVPHGRRRQPRDSGVRPGDAG